MADAWVILLALIAGAGVALAASMAWRALSSQEAVSANADALGPEARAVLVALRSTVIVLDAQDSILQASPSAYSYGLVRGGRIAAAPVAEMVAAVRAGGQIHDRELTLARGPLSGTGELILDVRVAPLPEGRLLLVAEDHTEGRRLDQMRRDFVANVSHELKTPVGAMSLLAEAIADAADDAETVRRFGGRIKIEAQRLTSLVQEIIDLSRLQDPDALVEYEVVAVSRVLAEAVDRVSVTSRAKQVDIAVGGEDDLRVYGDHDLLATAVRNLLDNAVRHSPEGARVSVGVRGREGVVRVAVVDQGEGIAPEHAERIFERFYRVDPARARKTGGTGLGLSIVKHIAAGHGGDVAVWSKPGKGSTFTLTLPLAPEPVAEEPSDSVSEPEGGTS